MHLFKQHNRVFSLFFLLFSVLPSVSDAYILAEPAIYRLNPRDHLYVGGWPLALTGQVSGACPAVASVRCPTNNVLNAACCPSGQSCITTTTGTQYCCPSDKDCGQAVLDYSVCANSSWVMYQAGSSSSSFFCCIPGQIGANSRTGYDGLCLPSDEAVPTSLLAIEITQTVALAAASTTVVAPAGQTGTTTTGNATQLLQSVATVAVSTGASSLPKQTGVTTPTSLVATSLVAASPPTPSAVSTGGSPSTTASSVPKSGARGGGVTGGNMAAAAAAVGISVGFMLFRS